MGNVSPVAPEANRLMSFHGRVNVRFKVGTKTLQTNGLTHEPSHKTTDFLWLLFFLQGYVIDIKAEFSSFK